MQNNNKQKQAIFLMGPTASGKTDLVIKLAKRTPIKIISVDSSMIYQGMDIGTGKPTLDELNQAPHYLIDIIKPNETYSVANFCNNAVELMQEASLENRLPVLVGGTMMYFNALINGLSTLPNANKEIRNTISQEAEIKGWNFIHEKLTKLDPESGARIHPNDTQRIQRAYEVNLITNKTMKDSFKDKPNFLADWKIKSVALAPNSREILHDRIAKRFYKMLELGFIPEVESLIKQYNIDLNYPAMRSVGYRQILNYLKGEYSFDVMQEKAIAATRQLAKRQFTWLKSWKNLEWLDVNNDQLLQSFTPYFIT